MKLLVERVFFDKDYTIGRLSIDGQDTGLYTLEPGVHYDGKIPGKTAIPSGAYKMSIDFSEHFKEILPHILNVPNFEGVRIHPGNTFKDTEGCILLGTTWIQGTGFIGESRKAFYSVFGKLKLASDLEIEIG